MIGNKRRGSRGFLFRIGWAGAAALGALALSQAARAEGGQSADPAARARTTGATTSAEVTGTVLGIDETDIVIDLGASKGATDGHVVEIWRPFKLRHPVTGQLLTDRFRIGSLRLVQVQKTLTLARPEGALARAAAPGDVVVMARPVPSPGNPYGEEPTTIRGDDGAVRASAGKAARAPEAATPSGSSSTSRRPEAVGANTEPVEAEGRELCALFDGLKGQPIEVRIARYEQYLHAHPRGTYARVLGEEAAALRQLANASATSQPSPEARATEAIFAPPSSALAGEPLTIGVELPRGAWPGAVLHVRHAGEVAFQPIPMRAAGARYFRAVIAPEQMKAPEVQYFVESVDAKGVAFAVVGTPAAPLRLEVHDGPRPFAPSRPLAMASIFTDYADYNRLRGNDYAWQTEGQFGLRYADKGVRAVRTGFGVYRGVGGSVEELDALGMKPRKVGLTYGYLEGEFATSRTVGFIGRLALGLNDDGVNAGGQFFVRLGPDQMTNLLLGGEVLGGVGTRGIAELQWNTLPRVPIVFRTEVTNQPAGATPKVAAGMETPDTSTRGGDIGARAVVQVGYRLVPELTLAARASYEGRTIQHAGPGAGAGVMYTW
jgi:hypothetical protein